MNTPKHQAEAESWLCECGLRCIPWSFEWRWNGKDWEHQHDFPRRLVVAKYQPKKTSPPSSKTTHEP